MCGRYAITLPPAAMRELFSYIEQPNFPQRWNIAPTQPVPVVRQEGDGQRHFVLMRWGLVPSWAREVGGKPLFNARGETVAEKPAFKNAFKRRRCLIPADGFYEWKPGAKTPKQPFLIRRTDRQPMAFAGIWEHWQTAEGSELESCSIITTAANATLAPLHHRMPVILDPADWAGWLDPSETPLHQTRIQNLIAPATDDLLDAVPVSRRVNAVANDDASIQDPPEPDPEPDATPDEEPRTEPDTQMSLF